jgi:hypothetical protein
MSVESPIPMANTLFEFDFHMTGEHLGLGACELIAHGLGDQNSRLRQQPSPAPSDTHFCAVS